MRAARGFALLVCVLAAAQALGQISPYTKITFTWNYSPNLPICGSTTVSCFSGFKMSDELSGHTIANLPPAARLWVFIPNGGVWYGKHVFDLIAVGFDANGAPDQSPPDSVVVDVVPPPSVPNALMAEPQ